MSYIKVCCAVIKNGDNFLAVQRNSKMSHPQKWEFPGGKIESEETAEQALIREIKEELSVDIEIIFSLNAVKFNYPDKSIELFPFVAKISKGSIHLTEHQSYLWLNKQKLPSLDWLDADIPVVKEILSRY